MKREIKFRGKRQDNGEWVVGDLIHKNNGDVAIRTYLNVWVDNSDDIDAYGEAFIINPATVGQYTGLKDKNSNARIFDGDLLSLSGTLIGNQYENEDLLKDRTNLLIEGLCTKEWIGTYQEAIKRGCVDAK